MMMMMIGMSVMSVMMMTQPETHIASVRKHPARMYLSSNLYFRCYVLFSAAP